MSPLIKIFYPTSAYKIDICIIVVKLSNAWPYLSVNVLLAMVKSSSSVTLLYNLRVAYKRIEYADSGSSMTVV